MRLVASFPNRSEQPHNEFIMELTVGWIYLAYRGTKLRRVFEYRFAFDTGAHVTCIVQSIAQQLNLPNLDSKPVNLTPLKGLLKAKLTEIEIRLGDKWERIPCCVPWGDDSIDENLLGMEGLLSKYRFVLDQGKLEMYEP